MHGQRRTQRAAGIAGGRLDPDVVELPVAQHLAVGHAVQRDTAGETKIAHAGFGANRTGQLQHDLLRCRLDRGGQIHMVLGQRFAGRPRRTAEQFVELRAGHGQAGAVIEVGLVEPEGAIRLQVDQVIENLVDILGLAIGRQAHQFVFARIHLEAGVVGKRRIQQAERMREVDFLEDFQRVAAPDGQRGGGPFADAVHGQHGGLLEGRGEEGAGGMAQVVLGEAQPAVPSRYPAHGGAVP